MARGGINRAVVKIARDALLARGVKPSIDAIRIELGNTGSKTTIIRCLRELEQIEAPCQPPSLEEELSILIGKVAERMRDNAQASIASERELLTQEHLNNKIQRQQALEKIEGLQSTKAELESQL
ncbi:DNA-binding protein [Pseudomonas pseudonitroreducens]|uniref:DNA-binding protein n=1 Tax=Pseudomonas pseudonitroreducens TaxID=2892326 RepID=UPI001F20B936|nr:DNA-binding protein [Pseudomonas pseudonitroreducens]